MDSTMSTLLLYKWCTYRKLKSENIACRMYGFELELSYQGLFVN